MEQKKKNNSRAEGNKRRGRFAQHECTKKGAKGHKISPFIISFMTISKAKRTEIPFRLFSFND